MEFSLVATLSDIGVGDIHTGQGRSRHDCYPFAGGVLSGNTLYGTANLGGNFGQGTVWGVQTDGSGFTNLYNFAAADDVQNPYDTLVLSGSALYGRASAAGGGANGTVFGLLFFANPKAVDNSNGNQRRDEIGLRRGWKIRPGPVISSQYCSSVLRSTNTRRDALASITEASIPRFLPSKRPCCNSACSVSVENALINYSIKPRRQFCHSGVVVTRPSPW